MLATFLKGATAAAAAPVEVVSSELTNAGSATSITVNKPSDVVEGNLLFAVINCNAGGRTLTVPSGWTLVNTTVNRFFAYKTADGSEPSSYTFTFSSSVSSSTGGIVNLSPCNVDVVGTTSASGVNATAPGITVTSDNSLVLLIVTANTTSNTVATPTDWTLVYIRTLSSAQAVFSRSYNAGATGDIATTSSASGTRASLVSFAPA